MQTAAPSLSIVIPMYREEQGVDALFKALVPVLHTLALPFEIIAVDDGSDDATLARLSAWHAHVPQLKIIALSRNFGKEAALTAGLHYATGEAIIPMDADLQDPPALIPELVEQWQKGYKVVLATRRSRSNDTRFKRRSARLFYWLMSRISAVELPADTGDFRLMDRQVAESLKRMPERARFMKGMFAWVGFSTATVFYDRPPRAEGEAKQSFRSLWRLAKDGVFSFTTLPLRLTTYLGLLFSLGSFVYGGFLVLRTLIYGVDVAGYASIMVGVLFMGGVQLVCLGIIGEYIGRIYREVKQRPLFIVEKEIGF